MKIIFNMVHNIKMNRSVSITHKNDKKNITREAKKVFII